MIETECDEMSTEYKGEFFDLAVDPWEMTNIYDRLSGEQHQILMERLNEFKTCKGDKCRELYTKPINIVLNNPKEKEEEEIVQHQSKFTFDSILLNSLL